MPSLRLAMAPSFAITCTRSPSTAIRTGRPARSMRRVPSGLHRRVEQHGEIVGLPMPWVRFDTQGHVINGPAAIGLSAAELPTEKAEHSS
jgi:hypothetical protein